MIDLRERFIRALAENFFRAALEAADPETAIRRAVRLQDGVLTVGEQQYDYRAFRRVWVIGAGKASARMAKPFDSWENLSGGLINTKYEHLAPLHRIRLNECSHPVPDDAGVRGA